MRSLVQTLVVGLLLFVSHPEAGTSGVPDVEDLLKLRSIAGVQISPDGKWVVYVLRTIEPKPDAKDDWIYRTQLWLAAVDGSTAPRQLTFGAARNSSPAWSPAGRSTAPRGSSPWPSTGACGPSWGHRTRPHFSP